MMAPLAAAGRYEDLLEEARRFFNDLASWWEQRMDQEARRRSHLMLQSLGIKKGGRVLDVGTGTGLLLGWLREMVGAEGSVCALDLAENMLKVAGRLNGWEGLRLYRADASSMPFEDAAFDEVICHNCFHLFPRRSSVLREALRVLRPGGRLTIGFSWPREEMNRGLKGLPFSHAAGGEMPDREEMLAEVLSAGFHRASLEEGAAAYLLQAWRRPVHTMGDNMDRAGLANISGRRRDERAPCGPRAPAV